MKRDLTYAEVGWRNARSLTVAMNALCFVVEYGPVSYTHLDVYKRQPLQHFEEFRPVAAQQRHRVAGLEAVVA